MHRLVVGKIVVKVGTCLGNTSNTAMIVHELKSCPDTVLRQRSFIQRVVVVLLRSSIWYSAVHFQVFSQPTAHCRLVNATAACVGL